LLGADDAFAFLDEDDLVGLDVFEGFDEAAGPADFEELDVFRFADAKVHAQIVLRKIAAAATHFVDLRMQTLLARKMRDTFDARADAAAIGFRADGFDFDPVVGGAGIATQQLRKIVDGVDDDVEVAEIVVKRRRVAGEIRFDQVEIAVEIVIGDRDAHAGLRLAVGAESATSFDGDVGEGAVLLVLIKGAGGGIVGDVNVRPAVVVKI